jgi:hypothetical protein
MILIPGYTPDDFCQGDNYDATRQHFLNLIRSADKEGKLT